MNKRLRDQPQNLYICRTDMYQSVLRSQRVTGIVDLSKLTLLHSEWPKPYGVLAILSAIGLRSYVQALAF